MSVVDAIHSLGGVAHLDALRERGAGRAAVLAARRAGTVVQVRRAWYALRTADPDLISAVRVGGALTCVSAARQHGLWHVRDDGRLHVAMSGNAARLRPLDDTEVPATADPRLHLHWRERTWSPGRALQSIDDVLRHVVECQSLDRAVAVLDSAMRHGGIPRGVLERWIAGTPRGHRAADFMDARADSGGESIAREAPSGGTHRRAPVFHP